MSQELTNLPAQLLADADGNLTAAWLDGSALSSFPPGDPRLMVRRRTAGTQTWSPPEVETPHTFNFCMGIDRAGTVTVVYAGQGNHAFATRSVAGGTFSTPQTVAPKLAGHMDSRCEMAIGSDGTVTAVWPQRDRTPEGKAEARLVWVQLPAGSDTWARPRHLTPSGKKTDYSLWLSGGRDDSLLLVWQGTRGGPSSRLLPAHSTRWSATQKVSRNQFLDDVVNLGGGRATAMFDAVGAVTSRVVTSQRRLDGTWKPLEPIAPHRKGIQVGDQLSSWHGRTIALWLVGRYLEVSIRNHGRWGPPHEIVVGDGVSSNVQAYPNGAIRVVWTTRTSFSNWQLRTAVRGPHGAWGATTHILRHTDGSGIPSVQLLAHRLAALLDVNAGHVFFSETAPSTG